MSASRQIRPQPGTGSFSPGNRKTPAPASSSTGSTRTVSTRIGKYEVETELIGSGLVRAFHAWDRATGRRVTLKVLAEVADLSRAERFRREVAAMANLRHPNLVSIYELGEHVGMPFTALEYLGDDHLGHAIAGRRPFTLLDKMRVMCQVAEGVQAAHRGGLTYVGLRPCGVALSADGSAKVQEFGIVRSTPDGSGGVALYEEALPPGIPPDILSDIFAFGVIYSELLTGVYPLPAAKDGGTDRRLNSVAALRSLTPECPEALEQLVARAMEVDRELRYQTFDDIQYDAEPILREFERMRAAVLLEEARRWMESKDVDQALTAVREALDLDPGNPAGERLRVELRGLVQERAVRSRLEALLRDAEEETAARHYARAAELLEAAARLDTANSDIAAQLQQVRARLEQNRQTAVRLGEVRHSLELQDLTTAESRVLEILDADPENAEAIELAYSVGEAIRRREMEARFEQGIAKAKSLLLLESFESALEILSALEEECPGSPAVGQWLAHVRQQKEQSERRGRLEVQLDEARSLMAGQRFEEAAEGLERLRTEFPHEPLVSELLGECWDAAERASTISQAQAQCDALCREERFEKAAAVVDVALKAYPNDPGLSELRREVDEKRRESHAAAAIRQVLEETQWLLDQDRVDLAVQFLREKCVALPDQPALAARLAAVEQLQPEWERRRLVQDCLRRVAALEQAQQWPVALTVLEEALETCPASAELQEATSRLRARLRDQDLQKKLSRWVAETRQALADGDIEQAEQTLRRALDAAPEDPALLKLSQELERDKKFREEWRTAQVLVGRRQFEEAERILVRLDGPQRPEVQTLLKTVREARAASEEEGFYKRGREKALLLIQQKQTEQAADLLRNLLSLFPGDPILERDLQALGGGRAETRPETAPAPVKTLAATPVQPQNTRPAKVAAPVLPAPSVAWYRRGLVIAGVAFFLLISVGAALTRMLRGGPPAPAAPAPAPLRTASAPAAPASAPPLAAPVAAPPDAPRGPVAEPAALTAAVPPKDQPAPDPRDPRALPPQPRRAFNGAALSTSAAARTPAVLVPAPPISGTSASTVEPLPAGVTPLLRAPVPPPREAPAQSPQPANTRPVGGNIQQVQPISTPPPAMPLMAKERRISGTVNLDATVDKLGAITNVKVISGNPILVPAAVEGVKKWRYQPAVLNGQPIEAEIKVEVRFEMGAR